MSGGWDFYGEWCDHDQCRQLEELAASPSVRLKDAEYDGTKWYDYRGIHNTINTYLFADCYRRIYLQRFDKLMGGKSRPYTIGWRGDDVFADSGKRTSFWLARQSADSISTPYPLYISYAFDFTFDSKWKNLPLPSQLYSEPLVKYAVSKYLQALRSDPPMPTNSAYLSHNYCGTKDQDDFQAWMVDNVKITGNISANIANHVFETRLLLPKTVIDNFGKEALDKAFTFWSRLQ